MEDKEPSDIEKAIAEFEAKLKAVSAEDIAMAKGEYVGTPEEVAAAKASWAKKKADEAAKQAKWAEIEEFKRKKILEGIAASPGLAVGKVRNVHEEVPELMAKIKPGEVIVGHRLTVEHDAYLKKAAAFVTDTGGNNSSLAFCARRYGKPAVTGTISVMTEEATQLLKTGQRVIVDGTAGAVFGYAKEASKYCLDFSIEELSAYKASENVAALIKVLKFAKSPASRRKAINILVNIGNPKVVKSLAAILQDEKESEDVRANAADALGKIASDKATIALIAALGDWYYVMRKKASLTLREAGEPIVPLLISALSNENTTIRVEIIAILVNMGTKKAIEPLIVILRDKDEIEIVRINAGKALVQIGDRNKLIEPLTVVLEEGRFNFPPYDAREQAIEALVKIGDSRAVGPLLIKVAMEPIVDIATCQAVIALGDMRDSQAVDPLIELLEDKSSENLQKRGLAAEALGKIGSAKAVEPLARVLEDGRENPWVKGNAVQALRKILKGIESMISELIRKADIS